MNEPASDNQRRSRPVFGTGTLSALVIIAFLFGFRALQSRQAPAPPDASTARIAAGQEEGPTPDVSYILGHRAPLSLNDSQVQRLRKLSEDERSELAPIQKEIDAVTKDFEKWLSERSEKASPGQSIGEAGPDLGAAQRRAAAVRERYWDRAMEVLSGAQKDKVSALRRADMQKTLDRLGG